MNADIRVVGVRADRTSDGPFTSSAAPRLNWRTETTARDWVQRYARVRLDTESASETVVVDGAGSSMVEWPFRDIEPREHVTVRIRVCGHDGPESDWSDPLNLVGGTLNTGEWRAEMIGLDDDTPQRPTIVRTSFRVREGLSRATLYLTAHGAVRARIGGKRVDDLRFTPGWTSYPRRILYEVTDVTHLLHTGDVPFSIDLAGAWWTESFGHTPKGRGFYGDRPATAAQLVLDYDDGGSDTILTDGTWQATPDGPLMTSSLYDGERYDARRQGSVWTPVRVDPPGPIPSPRSGPPVRVTQALPVQDVITSPSGTSILDFGQNLVGHVRFTVRGERGTTITLRHAEVLEHGELGVRPLRSAKATDEYILSGEGEETWAPEFTFHGFRYAEVVGWPCLLDPQDFVAEVVGSDLTRTGWFTSSHPLLNQFHENVVWSMRGNFLSVPTDCPQRDERMGWTGDIQIFAPTAAFLFDVDGFLASWLEDVAIEQSANGGSVPWVVPNVLGDTLPAAAWGDATCVVPHILYERYGDMDILRRHLPWMEAWARVLVDRAGERMLWEDGFQFGDWLDPAAPPLYPAEARTNPDIVASAYLFRSADLTSRAAEIVGEEEIAEQWAKVATRVKDAFVAEYVTPAGRMASDAQTAYALAIVFGLYRDDTQRMAMGTRLAVLVREAGYRIGTGFVGTPLVVEALSLTGHDREAGRLLTQTESPSWLHPVALGATTVWERWDSMLPDGSVNAGEMTSFNHYALGAVADWVHRRVGGLAPGRQVYGEIDIAPQPIDGIDMATTAHLTPHGKALVAWAINNGQMRVDAVVPPNSRARVDLPGLAPFIVGSGTHTWTLDDPRRAPETNNLSLQSPLASLMDDRGAYEAMRDAVLAARPDARDLWEHIRWRSKTPLRAVLPWADQDAAVRSAADALKAITSRQADDRCGPSAEPAHIGASDR